MKAIGFKTNPELLAVLASRVTSIVREMQTTLVRSGRSAVLNTARDCSCALVTDNHELLGAADGLPVHVFGLHLATSAIAERHPVMQGGDAFLHNDPYSGGTHAADHTIVVPVVVEGEVLFYSVAKAHQADCGNSRPTTYMAFAADVYEEGALIFPGVKVQEDNRDVSDVIEMCKRRIRVPDQWYGDYLATLGAARIGQRRTLEMCDEFGIETVKTFTQDWLAYSEAEMKRRISELPEASFEGISYQDPLHQGEDGVPIKVAISVAPREEKIVVDMRDNIDCLPSGFNQSQATALANALTGVFNGVGEGVPRNAGSFSRVDVRLREGSALGIPEFPASCSVATTNLASRIICTTQHAIAENIDGFGMAECASGMGPSSAVISGIDRRRGGNDAFINQQIFAAQGGPASARADGWLTFGSAVTNGLMNRDSVEVSEQKYPIHVAEVRIREDSEGAGQRRGAPGTKVAFGPAEGPMTVSWIMDGSENPPRGARGGGHGGASVAYSLRSDGTRVDHSNVESLELKPGELIVHLPNGGGGYGSPVKRELSRVLADVKLGIISTDRARNVYGAVIRWDDEVSDYVLDEEASVELRARTQSGVS